MKTLLAAAMAVFLCLPAHSQDCITVDDIALQIQDNGGELLSVLPVHGVGYDQVVLLDNGNEVLVFAMVRAGGVCWPSRGCWSACGDDPGLAGDSQNLALKKPIFRNIFHVEFSAIDMSLNSLFPGLMYQKHQVFSRESASLSR